MSDSDAFITSAIQHTNPDEAIKQAIQNTEINPVRVQDVIFGLDESQSIDTQKILAASGLTCSAATVSSSLRALFFAAQSILSEDVNLVIVVGLENNSSTAILLASPDAVGRWNLLPRARIAARSLTKIPAAENITVNKNGKFGAALAKETLEELEKTSAQWGMVTANEMTLVLERI